MEPRGHSLSEPFISLSAPSASHQALHDDLVFLGFDPRTIEHIFTTHHVRDIDEALGILSQEPCPLFGQLEVCRICLEPRDVLKSSSCGHRFCEDCLKGYVEVKVMSGQVLSIACPQADCGVELSITESLLSPELLEKFRRFRHNQLLNQEPNVRWCPTPDCETVLRGGSTQAPRLHCDLCGADVCFNCGERWHDEQTCGQAADSSYATWAVGKDIQHCPMCRRRIEKEDGCNHMQCPGCSYQWCWLCRGRYTDMHYSPLNPFGCPGLQSAEHTLARWPWYKRWLLRLFVLFLFPLVLLFGVPVLFTYKTMELLDECCYMGSALCSCFKYCIMLPLVFTLGVLCTPLVIALSCPPLICFLFVHCLIELKFQARIWTGRPASTSNSLT